MAEQTPDAKRIFLEALENYTPDQWPACLDEACGSDAALRQRVEALLEAQDESNSMLDGVVRTIGLPPITETPGTVIGSYKLLEQIGEGGFGVVYLAEQTKPVRRQVALKIIKPGMDTRQVIARFEAERQALALMDHPNIAKVHDGGATESGRPYFVMELVKGIPISEYCDQCKLPARERLELFHSVCQAVQHAHQKGIIHRDIKPTNVLIAMQDGRPAAKVIDFGVAKAINQRLTEQTLQTGFSQMLGTPIYMSPEQAEMSPLEVDTRTDIYSLGVLLYELLTGTTPFEKERLSKATFDELRKIIRREEPPRPSARISTLKADLASTIAGQRRSEPHKLSQLVRGDLDWIVMKCLEKDRTRRYPTANEFAADIQRYLNDEPVLASPPSLTYRLRKYARRNKLRIAMATALTVAVLLAVGSIAGSIGWMSRDRATREARVTDHVTLILEEAGRLAKEQKWHEALAVAERAETLANGGEADAETEDLARRTLADLEIVKRLEEVRLRISVWTLEGFDRLGADSAYQKAFRDLGLDLDKMTLVEAAALLRSHDTIIEPLVLALDEWIACRAATMEQPNAKSLEELVTAIDSDPWRQEIRAEVKMKDPAALERLAAKTTGVQRSPSALRKLASALWSAGGRESAIELLTKACREHPDDFWLHFELAQECRALRPPLLEKAVKHYTAALAIRPRAYAVYVNLGIVLDEQAEIEDATACFHKAIELSPQLSQAHHSLGVLLISQGEYDKGIACYKKAIEVDPNAYASHFNLGLALKRKGNLDGAILWFRKALELDPNLADAHTNIGDILKAQGFPDEAIVQYKKVIELKPASSTAHTGLAAALINQRLFEEASLYSKKAIELDPSNAHAHANLGGALVEQRKLDAALPSCNKAIELDPNLAYAYYNRGNLYRHYHDQKKYDLALADYNKALELDPDVARVFNSRGLVYRGQRKYDLALADFSKAIELNPDDAKAYGNRGLLFSDQKKYDLALADYNKAMELDPEYAPAYNNRGLLYWNQEKHDLALADFNKAIELKPDYAAAYNNRGLLYWNQEKHDLALADYNKTIELMPDYAYATYAYTNRALIYSKQKKYDLALADYNKAIELKPDFAGAYQGLGLALSDMGRLQEAVAAYKEAVRCEPDFRAVRVNLAWILATAADPKLRDGAEALVHANKAIELKPTAPGWQVLGWARYRTGDWKGSIEALEKSCERQGGVGDPWQWFFLAMGHWQLGNREGLSAAEQIAHQVLALRHYDESVQWMERRKSNNQEWLRFRAEAEELMGVYVNPGQYADLLDKAIRLSPDDPQLLVTRGGLYARQGQIEKAVADLARVVELGPSNRHEGPSEAEEARNLELESYRKKAQVLLRQIEGKVIVPVGSTWKWLHPTDDTDPATTDADFHTTFFNANYDDSHWQSGKDSAGTEGGFGYGDPVGVDIGQPAPGNRKTAYFRHTFQSDAAFDNLIISMQWDDGVIIYLDGVEVGRDNVGQAVEAYDLYAKQNGDETAVRHILLSGMLAAGDHVLAISLHNRLPDSSDLRIAEISIAGRRVGSEPPKAESPLGRGHEN